MARRGEPAFDALVDALMPGNRAWAGNAAALLLVAAAETDATGRRLAWNRYDAGQAVAHLTVQAQAEGLVVHQMGGFDPAAAAAVFDLDAGVQPLVVVAVGHHDPAVVLPEPLAAREHAPRERVALDDLLLAPARQELPLSA